jgi:hypothetical protein
VQDWNKEEKSEKFQKGKERYNQTPKRRLSTDTNSNKENKIIPPVPITNRNHKQDRDLTGSQLLKKLVTFYGTRRFITAFTSARHLSLS